MFVFVLFETGYDCLKKWYYVELFSASNDKFRQCISKNFLAIF